MCARTWAPKITKKVKSHLQVLPREDLRRGQHAHLGPLPRGLEHGQESHRRLPGPHVPLQQPEHSEAGALTAAIHVTKDLIEGYMKKQREKQTDSTERQHAAAGEQVARRVAACLHP